MEITRNLKGSPKADGISFDELPEDSRVSAAIQTLGLIAEELGIEKPFSSFVPKDTTELRYFIARETCEEIIIKLNELA